MSTPPGCGFVSFGADGSPTYLPLKSVSARVYIVDTFTRVVLTQLYTNDNADRSSAAQYVFPVPAGGAVCAFKMQTSGGQVVNGVVKERSKAKNEYDVAILNNQWAGLLYEATPDVFVISMGAIAAEQDVEVTIMYVVELSDGDLPGYDQAEFRLQTYIADRYGRPPKELASSSSSSVGTTFDVTVEIQMTSELVSISSRSHSIIVDKRNWKDARTSMHSAKVKLNPSVSARLDRDFVLSIQSSKLGQPRCVAERRPSEMTIAMSLTFVPRFELDQLPNQEYIFLIDRSGSMDSESRINHAMDALLILLKSLPNEGTLFNIFSFGSSCSSLWYSSQQYTSSTLSIALQHVNSMTADMGGTEIENSLRRVLMSRNHAVPTSVFLLTDGAVYEHDNIFRLVDAEVMKAGNAANGTQLRIFTLGVGDAASTTICEGIARRGNGLCLMTAHSADISQKCARLLAASTVPSLGSIGDIAIDWGYVSARSSLKNIGRAQSGNKGRILFNEEYNPLARTMRRQPVLADPPKVQQAPTDVPDLYPANRFTVYAILSDTDEIPETVTLHGTLPNGSQLSLPPVDVYEASDMEEDFPPLIHTLAANRLITELEDGNTASQGAFDDSDEELREAVIEAAVVRFSETYQLASKFASFIAVDEGTKDYRDGESDASRDSSGSDSDHDQLDGLDGKSYDDPAASVYSDDDDDDDSDILDGKDDDEFYSALSSAASAHSLNLASQYSQTPSKPVKLSNTQPASITTPNDQHNQSQNLTASTYDEGDEFYESIDDKADAGMDTSDVPAEPLQGRSKNAAAGGSDQGIKVVDPDYSPHLMALDPREESTLGLQGEAVSPAAAHWFGQPASPSSLTVGKTLVESVERVQPQSSQPMLSRLVHKDGDEVPSPMWTALEDVAPVQVTALRACEAEEIVYDSDLNLHHEVRPWSGMESLPKLQTALPPTPIPVSVLGGKAEFHEVLFRAEDGFGVAESSATVGPRLSAPFSTAIDVYRGSPTTLSLAERNSVELESLEGDMLGLAEPPSAGSRAYESIDSVLSKLSMKEQTAVGDYQYPDDGGSEASASSSPMGGSVLSDCAEDGKRLYIEEGYPRNVATPEGGELLASTSPSIEAFEVGPYVIADVSRSPSPEEHPNVLWIPASAASNTKRKPSAIVTPSATTSAPIVAAARLQHYDGSFDLDDKLCSLMGKNLSTTKLRRTIPSNIRGHQDAERIWATILAAAYMKTCLADNRDVWIGLWQKATIYIKARLGADISLTYLVDEASKLL